MNARSRRPLSWQLNRRRKLQRKPRRRPRRKPQTLPAERHPRRRSRRGRTWLVSIMSIISTIFRFHPFPNCADALQMLWNRCLQKWTSFTSVRSRKSRNFGRKLRSATRPSTTFGSTCAARVRRFLGFRTCPPEPFLHCATLRPPPFRTLLPRQFPLQATSPQRRPAFLSSAL